MVEVQALAHDRPRARVPAQSFDHRMGVAVLSAVPGRVGGDGTHQVWGTSTLMRRGVCLCAGCSSSGHRSYRSPRWETLAQRHTGRSPTTPVEGTWFADAARLLQELVQLLGGIVKHLK